MENKEKQPTSSALSYGRTRNREGERRKLKRRHSLRQNNKGRSAKRGHFAVKGKRKEAFRGDGRSKARKFFGKLNKKKNLRQKRAKPAKVRTRKRRVELIKSDLQITGGKHLGKILETTASPKVRITPAAVRQALFRALRRRIRMKRFLDLCAGAGTVGIEALSRGALLGTFVERSAKMCSFIRKNMEICGIKQGHGEIFQIEAIPFLKRMKKRRRYWDVVYFNPPYDANYDEVLEYFKKGAAVAPKGGMLVIEHPAEMFFDENLGVLKRVNVLTIGDVGLTFYERVS
ncbi:MAG: RsmD family RNA methyltransferase [Pyrinomonadaceae bacterium]|nr:RsmD family RNA methyltransferase [Pyrinomonadaceae bacterium]MCX7639858.1 RsmD family RNA methyltransferase [Pyrinomonadaceae bacterium]MDW8304030.1 RsmD family RNA methyltransferase [Acidobacteriota bacterium]